MPELAKFADRYIGRGSKSEKGGVSLPVRISQKLTARVYKYRRLLSDAARVSKPVLGVRCCGKVSPWKKL